MQISSPARLDFSRRMLVSKTFELTLISSGIRWPTLYTSGAPVVGPYAIIVGLASTKLSLIDYATCLFRWIQ